MLRKVLFVLGSALSLALVQGSALRAADEMKPAADKGPAAPLSATFEKVADAENGPFVLNLKNGSKEAVTAKAKVLLSVAFHAESKARPVPEQVIEPGKTWSIKDLAAGDKVIVHAKGFAPLELVVK
jgi:hypothetical protein